MLTTPPREQHAKQLKSWVYEGPNINTCTTCLAVRPRVTFPSKNTFTQKDGPKVDRTPDLGK
jgi:hypothetical protein